MKINESRRRFVISGMAMTLVSALSSKVFAMAGSTIMSEVKKVSGAEFWELYFQNRFITLQRLPVKIQGEYLEEVSEDIIATKVNRQRIKIEIDRQELKKFDFLSDKRFSSVRFCESGYLDLLQSIKDQSYLYIDRPPFGTKRMSELARDILKEDSETKFSMRFLMEEMFDQYKISNSQHLRALLWVCGECRNQDLAAVVVRALDNDSKLPKDHQHKLQEPVIRIALEALSKINDKSQINTLLNIMDRGEHSTRLIFASLMKRMLSTDTMLSLEELGEEFYSSDFWRKLLQKLNIKQVTDWNEFDFQSLYWENRYLAVYRAERGDNSLVNLFEDEVPVVSDLAKTKMV